ncbi:MAG TPA: acyl-CoA dehydrogenase family protein [Thermoanaerobaculia bacterium]|nr:acyl-CoA dehydrogenase family protein [Thermoanaerobaculia bacterium]
MPNGPGVDFSLTEEQELLRGEVRRFAEERLRPGLAERDRSHRLPVEELREMGEMGLLGMLVPEEFGGAGQDPLTYCLAVEEVARVCPATAVTMSVTNSVCQWPVARFGSEELQRRVLPELASGAELGGFGLTEPESGSDAAAMRTVARRDGDSWILDGQKAWITNAGVGKWFVVLAKSDPAAGKKGISAFVVGRDMPGFAAGAPEEKLGLKASVTGSLYLSGCRVPGANLLGEEGQGMRIALATLDHSRLGIAAQAVGIHQRALELAVAYARERVQFGVPIARHQAVQFTLAKMATELAAARALTYHAAALSERDPQAGRLAAEAKLYASEAANRACFDALQIHGGNGFSEEYEIARLYRDVRVTTIYEGTSEMQRLVIARHLLPR